MNRALTLLISLYFLISSSFASLSTLEKEHWKHYLRTDILLTDEQKPWLFKEDVQKEISKEFGRFWTGLYGKEDPFYQKLRLILQTDLSYDTLTLLLEHLDFYAVGANGIRTNFYYYQPATQLTLRLKPDFEGLRGLGYVLCFYDSKKAEELEEGLCGEPVNHSAKDLSHELCKLSLLMSEEGVFPLLLPKSRHDMLSYQEFLTRFSLSGDFPCYREIYELLKDETMAVAHPVMHLARISYGRTT